MRSKSTANWEKRLKTGLCFYKKNNRINKKLEGKSIKLGNILTTPLFNLNWQVKSQNTKNAVFVNSSMSL